MYALNSLSFISRDSRTPRNSGTNFNLEEENVTGNRYITHLYWLVVQTVFYSDVLECRTLSMGRIRSPVGKILFPFFTCYIHLQQGILQGYIRPYHQLNPSLAEQDMPCLSKECRSRSVGFNWSGYALFVIQYVNMHQQPGSSNLIGWKLEVGVAS